MKTIKILHLYSDTLDLYGDYKNITVLKSRIEEAGQKAEIKTAQHWDKVDFKKFDMVYMGHGKINNLKAVAPHFLSYKEKIINHIESGGVWLVTGNSRELFGTSFETLDGEVEGLALFDYKGEEKNKVIVADLIGNSAQNQEIYCYGFTNRTAHLKYKTKNETPLFVNTKGFTDGEEKAGVEGTHYKNFFATWSMGPVLLRNPFLMKQILKALEIDFSLCDFSLEEKALSLVIKEFNK